MTKRVIFHIDVNSAYLSWEAVYQLQQGSNVDLREIPSVVGGDIKKRSGIVLAKSIPAKKYNIKTGETLFSAKLKCPHLVIVPPRYKLYMDCSAAMGEILKKYSPSIQFFSIDEVFLDYTNLERHFGPPEMAANLIKDDIKKTLGFTVNIGIGSNKLLAKMASEFEKPDKVHTLFTEEIPSKLWPLPVDELFMVGSKTKEKLLEKNIKTIGQLANTNPNFLYSFLKSHGILIWNYANGRENSPVRNESLPMKCLGNSTTIPFDVTTKEDAHKILMGLTENLCFRLRNLKKCASVVSVSIKNNLFEHYSHQKKLSHYTNCTKIILESVKILFAEMWNREPIRQMGIQLTDFCDSDFHQLSFFDPDPIKYKHLDNAIDKIRLKYGKDSIFPSCYLHSKINPLQGGVIKEEDYPMMSSIL
ncbi:DNA polymerase-4 [Anaerobranca californiensis DSM 14826]|jgi:DNA polymerase-4|uniref:DNA polymerase IV n=1 Tax=Anaerobranca californiensis DSM 14826 TaxID=1120989 RepID=A0A1M6KLF7_9FIRM|nr:DNA polymerase IV [Anaerobranca californiensis]SHJ59769.1 DNA polymerase-4 [Anaerobranca californiensis DSM 14826]